ncbi:serine hydrolase domain-containing protein [Kordiimonas aquimaris]|uniref:serine hydrolase domain-containing protein n=1 Tax=Kordiimonas aquimaris TaxID=707591 RepID=UPI0021CE4B87|nr:serine hydrolase domain-containing protein [Kordiimonas aquimaris]
MFRVFSFLIAGMSGFWLAALLPVGADDYTDYHSQFLAGMAEKKIPGAAYAIIEDGEPVSSHVYGTRVKGQKLPVTPKTVFRMASVSKTFAASLAAMLVEDGVLDLDAGVKDYVPNFRLKKNDHVEKLRVRHLLSHTIGLTPNAYDNMIEDGWDMQKILPRFRRLNPICAPGKCYGYQNIVFSLIEPVIEQRTNRPYAALVQERIFDPLNMQQATVGLEGYFEQEDRADPHINTRRGWYHTKVKPNYYNLAPAAGVNASLNDMIKWVAAHMGNNPDVVSNTVINLVSDKQVRTKRELYKRQWRAYLSNAHYGLGWRIYNFDGHEVVMHAGGVAGFRSIVSYSKELGIGHVMMMNAESRVIDDLTAQFWDGLFADLKSGAVAAR